MEAAIAISKKEAESRAAAIAIIKNEEDKRKAAAVFAKQESERKEKERQDALLAVMFSLGYKMMLINEHDLTLTTLTGIEIHNDMGRTNYLFVPEEKTKKIIEIFY